jgi:hypothetical protein
MPIVVRNFVINNVSRDTLRPTLPLVPCVGFSSLFDNGYSLPLTYGFLWTLCLYVKMVRLCG